jgi:hypothetical protein
MRFMPAGCLREWRERARIARAGSGWGLYSNVWPQHRNLD